MIPNPWMLFGALIAVIMLCAGSYAAGQKHQKNADQAAQVQAVSRAIAQAEQVARQDAEIAANLEKKRAKIRIVYREREEREIYAISKNPIYSRDCIDADGLRLWREYNAGTGADTSSKPNDPMPSATTTNGGDRGGATEKSSAGNGAVLRMPGQSRGLGGVGE